MDYDFYEMEESIEETRMEVMKESIGDVISLIVGIGVACYTAKELSKILPNSVVVGAITLATQRAVSGLFSESITLGQYLSESFKNRRNKMVDEIVND